MNEPSLKAPLSETRFLRSDEMMRILGYADRASFWVAIKASGLPHVKVSQRRALFEESVVREWLNSRTVGRTAP
jgi:predicted DNA-binding transcriptional regulator AlpA